MVRRKVETGFVENKEARMVTFAKRKNGIFKKASELSILCGVRVVIVGFSISGKPFSICCDGGQGEPSENGETDKLVKELEDLTKQIEVEKKKKGKLADDLIKNQLIKGKVCVADRADLGFEELMKSKASLEVLRDDLEVASSLLLLAEKPVIMIN